MNRKQEAIEILRELATLDIMTDGYPPLSKYYDRIAPLIQDKPKGTCQKCRGRRFAVPYCPTDPTSYCPDCKGTGECQHEGKMAYAAADNDNWLPRCLDCREEVERRSGEERREGKEIRCTAIPIFEIGQILPFGGYIRHNEIIPQGWHEDRRIRYVPDRRKAA